MKVNGKERNYGVDFLRILAMFMIVTMHILEHGGVLENAELLSFNYCVLWLVEIFTYCGVDCYALISGYVNSEKTVKYSNIIMLWCEVFFYNAVITLIFGLISPESIDFSNIASVFFPVITKKYWYFTAYFCMFFFIPCLNIIVDKLPQRSFKTILISIFILFTIVPTLSNSDVFILKYGFSTGWLMCLYLVGGYIKKYNYAFSFRGYKCEKNFLIFLGCLLFTYLSKIGIEFATAYIGHYHSGNIFVNYTSPAVFIASIALLLYCSKLELKKSIKPIAFFAPTTFGIYIIHEQSLFREFFILGKFEALADINVLLGVVLILTISLTIFFVLACVDWGRIYLFKIIKLKKLFSFVDKSG